MKTMARRSPINALDIETEIVIFLVGEEEAITRSTALIPDAMHTRAPVKTIDARRVVMMIVGAIRGKDLLIDLHARRIKPNPKPFSRKILTRHIKFLGSLNQ